MPIFGAEGMGIDVGTTKTSIFLNSEEAVALLTEDNDLKGVENICREALPPYWRPRHYQHIAHLPTTPTGKPARKKAEEMLITGK